MTPFLIGIAGGSGSGKTTLAARLVERLNEECATVYGDPPCSLLSLDSYYRCQGGRPFEDRYSVNYDHPDAYEVDLVLEQLLQIRSAQPVLVPRYDFATHSRTAGTTPLKPSPYLVIEGILVLHWPKLRDLMDLRLFVAAPAEIRLSRRLARDQCERGRAAESVKEQWVNSVNPMHLEFCEPTRQTAHHVVDGTGNLDEAVSRILQLIHASRRRHGSASAS